MQMTFSSYAEATQAARKIAARVGVSVEVKKSGGRWVVDDASQKEQINKISSKDINSDDEEIESENYTNGVIINPIYDPAISREKYIELYRGFSIKLFSAFAKMLENPITLQNLTNLEKTKLRAAVDKINQLINKSNYSNFDPYELTKEEFIGLSDNDFKGLTLSTLYIIRNQQDRLRLSIEELGRLEIKIKELELKTPFKTWSYENAMGVHASTDGQ